MMAGSSLVYMQRLLVGSSGIQWMMGGSLGVQWLLVGSLGVQWLMVVGTSSVNTSKYTIAGPLGQKHNGWSEKCYCSPIVYYSTRRFSQRCTTATTPGVHPRVAYRYSCFLVYFPRCFLMDVPVERIEKGMVWVKKSLSGETARN